MLFNEPKLLKFEAVRPARVDRERFSALQRAEIAEIHIDNIRRQHHQQVSVLFNEPKLLKSEIAARLRDEVAGFSALQRAEIAEIVSSLYRNVSVISMFQCSSTSRNC